MTQPTNKIDTITIQPNPEFQNGTIHIKKVSNDVVEVYIDFYGVDVYLVGFKFDNNVDLEVIDICEHLKVEFDKVGQMELVNLDYFNITATATFISTPSGVLCNLTINTMAVSPTPNHENRVYTSRYNEVDMDDYPTDRPVYAVDRNYVAEN